MIRGRLARNATTDAPTLQTTILKMRRAFRMALEWARANEVVTYVDKR